MSCRSSSFYYSFLVLPAAKRRAIVAVWDFCRAVDDTVDEREVPGGGPLRARELDEARSTLDAWRRDIDACYGSGSPVRPEARALLPHIAAFNLPRSAFEAVVEGVEMDLEHFRYENFEKLREYCLRVASAVGLISIEFFGYRDPRSRDFAVELGLALQLTTILRDVSDDLKRGRLYLPLEDLERFGCTPEDLAAGTMSGCIRELLKYEASRAREHYARAAAAMPRVDRRRLVAARIMGAIYADLLARIERNGYDVFSGVVRAPRSAQAMIAARTWIAAMAGL